MMTLTIEVAPEVGARLQEAAQRAGLDMQAYIGRLLTNDFPILPDHNVHNLAEWEHDMDDLAAGSENQPVLPLEAFSRESIYADHD